MKPQNPKLWTISGSHTEWVVEAGWERYHGSMQTREPEADMESVWTCWHNVERIPKRRVNL